MEMTQNWEARNTNAYINIMGGALTKFGNQHTSGKLDGKSLIEPSDVIEKRRKIVLHPSGSVPDGAIICYDSALWQWISSLPDRKECDGWLKGSYLVTHKDSVILVTKAAGFGAPTAVLSFEELVAYGIKKFVNLGTAGGLQKDMSIGDIAVCERATRDEGVLTVEMEASALFAVGTFRKVHVCSVFAISDILSEDGWNQGYHSEEKLDGLKQIFEAALYTLAKDIRREKSL